MIDIKISHFVKFFWVIAENRSILGKGEKKDYLFEKLLFNKKNGVGDSKELERLKDIKKMKFHLVV